MEELVDLIDEKGNVLGVVERGKAHKAGLLHRVVHVWVLNSKNEVLLQKRSPNKNEFPNVWDVAVGGHVRSGQKSLQTAQRETEEELGLDLKEDDFEFAFSFVDSMTYKDLTINDFVDVYIVRKDVDLKRLQLQKEEVGTVKWMPLTEFFACCMGDNFCPHKKGYEKLKEFLK